MDNWQYCNPVSVIFTDDIVKQIVLLLKDRVDSSILLMSYDWFHQTEIYLQLKKQFSNMAGFFDVEENPSFDSCQRAIDFAHQLSPNAIVAVGGGSVIDTAKVVRAALYKTCHDICKVFDETISKKQKTTFFAVPTTHGTGSEVTQWATIWDKQNKKKYSLSELENYPDFAIYSSRFMKDLPLGVALASTLDALSHAFESIWNKNRNPISTGYAIEAIDLIISNLHRLDENISPQDRKFFIIASLYAGLAFSNTKTAAAHSISYPLTAYFNIPHGIACSMPLYPLLKINQAAIQSELEELFNRLQVNSVDALWAIIEAGVENKIPFKLSEFGVKKEDLQGLIDLSFTKGRMDNNIVQLSEKDVRHVLEVIYI